MHPLIATNAQILISDWGYGMDLSGKPRRTARWQGAGSYAFVAYRYLDEGREIRPGQIVHCCGLRLRVVEAEGDGCIVTPERRGARLAVWRWRAREAAAQVNNRILWTLVIWGLCARPEETLTPRWRDVRGVGRLAGWMEGRRARGKARRAG